MRDQEKRKTASKASSRPPFELDSVQAPPGALTRLELPVSRLPTGMWVSLPVGVLHGARPGPVIWVSATMHGDELNGVPIIRHLLLEVDPATLSGTVLAVPIVNIFGLLQESRYLPDRRDLNRCFPGARRGSSASQLANLFMTKIVEHCELGIDLHTGSGGRVNLPQIRCNLDDPETFRLAREFGAPLLLHSRLRDGSLRAAATELGKKVLLYEAGEANRFNARPIRIGVDGVLRVMEALGMIEAQAPRPGHPSWVSRSSKWVRATRTGFCEMSTKLGDQVDEGQELAVIFNALTPEGTSVKAKTAGVVIGLLKTPLVHRGDAIAHIARVGS